MQYALKSCAKINFPAKKRRRQRDIFYSLVDGGNIKDERGGDDKHEGAGREGTRLKLGASSAAPKLRLVEAATTFTMLDVKDKEWRQGRVLFACLRGRSSAVSSEKHQTLRGNPFA